jgi:hypothetical protein
MEVTEPQLRTRRWGPATSSLVRRLAERTGPINQVALAKELGVSQPRISQILQLLTNYGIDVDGLETATNRRHLIDLYLRCHRPNVVSESLFYGLDPPYEQVRRAIAVARRHQTPVTVSSDLAPDLIAPWRAPTLTVIYCGDPLDLRSGPFVPATARGEAALVIRHVSDATLLDPWTMHQSEIPVVHPVQQVWDLYDLGGEDRLEGAQRLIDAVLS